MTAADQARRVPLGGAGQGGVEAATRPDLASALDATDVGLLVVDAGGVIGHVTRACDRLLGLNGSAVGTDLGRVDLPFDRAALDDAVVGAADGLVPVPFRTAPTTEFPHTLLVTVAPLPPADQDGGVAITLVDITAATAPDRQLNRELDRLNRSLGGFTQMVSHDLRAPLRHIVALAGFIREDTDGPLPEPIDLRLAQIEERARAMSGLIDDLLEYARTGTLRTDVQAVDLGELLADTVELVGTRDGIDVTINSDVGTVTTHPVPLSTCVRNLVDNAVTYHPGPTGTVGVVARLDGDQLLLTVTDDGDGVDPIHHRRIFEPMQSLERGTGLGLAAVTRILDERNGSISLDSEPGRGATFTIVWPLEVPQA